jgi:hypothetical protein
MSALRDDHVRIPLSHGTLLVPHTSCEALRAEFRHLTSMSDVRDAFDDAGTSSPVVLTEEQKGALIEVIDFWGSRVEGGLTDGLPPGIFDLRNALHDDLHHGANG